MSLPGITAPGGLPCFIAAQHSVDEAGVYGHEQKQTGHSRKVRLRTASDRRLSVQWFLTDDQMHLVDLWFEETLLVGSLPFSAHVANQGPGQVWWKATWAAPYEAEPIRVRRGLAWRVTGILVLEGESSATPPDTSSLAVEFSARLTGAGEFAVDNSLAVEFSAALSPDNPLAIEFSAQLKGIIRTYRLREGGGRRLREGGGARFRESIDV